MDVEEAPGFVQQEAKEEPDKTLSSWASVFAAQLWRFNWFLLLKLCVLHREM